MFRAPVGGIDRSVFAAQRSTPWEFWHTHSDANITIGRVDFANAELATSTLAATRKIAVARFIGFEFTTRRMRSTRNGASPVRDIGWPLSNQRFCDSDCSVPSSRITLELN
jgi:hypothetical protein